MSKAVLALLMLYIATALTAGRSAIASPTGEQAILALVKHGFYSVVLSVNADFEHAWACWTIYHPGPGTNLALIHGQGRSARVIWTRHFTGAYDPTITQLYGNVPVGFHAILFHYQLGADDAEAVLLALDRRDRVSVIGAVGGQSVDLLPMSDNLIQVTTSPADPRMCYQWESGTKALAERPCP